MDIAQVTIGLAFLAGLASFLSPCVFSLVPPISGIWVGAPRVAKQQRAIAL